MLGDYNIRTDLALEDKERFESDHVEISGVSIEEYFYEESEIKTTEVKIMTENGAKIMGKPVGTYITMEIPDDDAEAVAEEISNNMKNMIKIDKEDFIVLVVGLGNRNVTPDALGPNVIEKLKITRHIIKEYGRFGMEEKAICMTTAISPGVMGQTGMESSEIVRGITSELQPDLIIVIDALAARNTKRLNRTIQIADTGIHPGSGVGNHRNEISKITLGVPVIAIGVPTVVDAATIVRDAGAENIAPHLYGMFVTPKDIDESIERMSQTIADGLNLYFEGYKETNS